MIKRISYKFSYLNLKNWHLIWFNAIAPLQTCNDIKGFTQMLRRENIDSQFATKKEYLQTLYNDVPLNFSENGKNRVYNFYSTIS